jgi:hypothetical protein
MEVLNQVLDALMRLGLEPKVIPHGRIDELRGGICIELKTEGVDAALLLSRLEYTAERRSRYRVDYAVRGTIRGVRSGRVIAQTRTRIRGLLRRKVEAVEWHVPRRRGEKLRLKSEAIPPSEGELWEGCPHERLIELLNDDGELLEAIRDFLEVFSPDLRLSIFADGWGESIRIGGNLWLRAEKLNECYLSPEYLSIVENIGRYVRLLRKEFGGLAF